jgi:hypothetical protein
LRRSRPALPARVEIPASFLRNCIVLWCDAEVSLGWIGRFAHQLGQFDSIAKWFLGKSAPTAVEPGGVDEKIKCPQLRVGLTLHSGRPLRMLD